MATFNVEDAAFAGVGLMARKPLSVIAWAAIWAVFLVGVSAPFLGMAARLIGDVVRTQGHLTPEGVFAFLGGLIAWGLLLAIGSLCVGAVVQSAVIRAVTTPEQAAVAYVRFGSEEAHVLAVNFVKSLILFGVGTVVGAAIGIVTAFVFATGGGQGQAQVVRVIGDLVSWALSVWISLRLSLAAPMSFSERKFRLFESWTMTRGLDLRLLAVGAIIAVMVIAIYMVGACIAVVGGSILGGGSLRPGDVRNLLSMAPAQWEPVFAPYLGMIGVVALIATTLITPIGLAPWPRIYQALSAKDEPAEA